MKILEVIGNYPGGTADHNQQLTEFLKVIEVKCSDSIGAMRRAKKLLYRGISRSSSDNDLDIFQGKPRENRRPLDSSGVASAIINATLADRGFVARRDNSVFCTSKLIQAVDYGEVYCIFPVNGFAFTWSREEDLSFKSRKLLPWMIPARIAAYLDTLTKAIQTWLKSKNLLQDKPLDQAQCLALLIRTIYGSVGAATLRNSREVMRILIECCVDSAVPGAHYQKTKLSEFCQEWPSELSLNNPEVVQSLMDIDKFISEYAFQDQRDSDLREPLSRKLEVMIHGEYFAIKQSRVGSHLAARLFAT